MEGSKTRETRAMAIKAEGKNGIITTGSFILALVNTDRWITEKNNYINEEKEPLPTDSGYYKSLGISNKPYTDILYSRIDTGVKTYSKARIKAIQILRGLCNSFSDVSEYSDNPDQDEVLKQYLMYLKGLKVDTDTYEKILEEDGYESLIVKLDEDVNQYIYDLFNSNEETKKKTKLREYPIRILLNCDNESSLGNVNKVIESIQKEHANPIIINSLYKEEDSEKYDIYYVIENNNISRSVVDIIEKLPNSNGYPRIRIFKGDNSFPLDEELLSLCKKRDIEIKLFNDVNVYKYDIYTDLLEIIEERNQIISEYFEKRSKYVNALLSENKDIKALESLDFKPLKDPINLYNRKSSFYREFVNEYISEQRQIAEAFPENAGNIYPELIELAKEHDIQMDVMFDFAKYLKEEQGKNVLAIEYAEQYRAYKEYRKEINADIYKLYMFLGEAYNGTRKLDMAVSCLAKAQELIPSDNIEDLAYIISLRAGTLWEAGRFTEAVQCIDENIGFVEDCYKKNPDGFIRQLAKLYRTKGNILHAKRKLEEARTYLIKAIKVWNKDADLDNIEEFDIEKVDFSELNLDEKIEATTMCNNLGILNRRRNNYEESIKYFDFCLSIRKEIFEQNPQIDDYSRKYGVTVTNKACMLSKIGIALGKANTIEVTRLFDESIRLKSLAKEKDSFRYNAALYWSYADYARFCLEQGDLTGAEENIKKAEDCIGVFKDQEKDNSHKRFNAGLERCKAKLEIKRLKEGEKPSEECGNLLKSAFMTYDNLANKHYGFYLEDLANTGMDLLEYYKMVPDCNEMDIDTVYGKTLAAASSLAQNHDVYNEKYESIKKWSIDRKE